MKIKVEVTRDELEEMDCDSPAEFQAVLRHQIDKGVASDDGEAGVDWMVDYELEIVLVDA
ncbi:hypothetical protein [Ralstonia pickettii]|uniref:Uncharacterized protein n=1 Tax=Ralstonia pickettii TaxID=329 RepID=A0AAW4Q7S4_RALPI|nr:hypothetical protein [Ralstonia pickettii]MBA9846806.1 hypothetical protein [Ralstonia pickettii]MBA9852042.1 hypothetical protein [Ralstonia pickettii]MBA9919943.1 hypothetical protein [Ralstonia pickettii]MBA9959045.1 hypothetical protein [Ralstonia pickettii]MBA9964577.1 hypothetical protein [Ralstonia pickettii]